METQKGSRAPRLGVMWKLSWPAIIEQVLATMVSYVDTAMVGVLGASATAAVSVNAASIWLINGILAGVGVGYSVQVSNAIGARDIEKGRAVIRQSLLAALVAGGAALILFQILAGFIPLWLGAEPDVLPHAAGYLRWYTTCMPFAAMGAIFSAVLRCMGNTKAPLYLNTLANLLNIVFNFFLIYDSRPFTIGALTVTIPGAGLGVEGAAIASALSWAAAGLTLWYAAFHQGDAFRISLRGESFRPDRAIIRQAVHLGLPSAIERATINLGQIAMTYVVASLGTVALAANQIANTAEGLCYLPAYGISYAGIALVGQSVGAKNKEDARGYGSLAGKMAFVLCLGTAVLLFLLARPLASLFNSDPAVVDLAALVLRIVAVCEPLFAVAIVFSGTLRGANDVRFPMVVSLICMWGVRIVLAPILVYKFDLGLAGVWIAMDADLILRGVLCTLRWRSGRWETLCGLAEPGASKK